MDWNKVLAVKKKASKDMYKFKENMTNAERFVINQLMEQKIAILYHQIDMLKMEIQECEDVIEENKNYD